MYILIQIAMNMFRQSATLSFCTASKAIDKARLRHNPESSFGDA